MNKVSTKADIRFDVVNCRWMSQALKQAVMQREAGRMNKNVRLGSRACMKSRVARAALQSCRLAATKMRLLSCASALACCL